NETSTEGAATSGGGGGTVLATVASAPAAPALSASDVRALLARYTQEILRTRIAANLVYPPEAERVGAEGTVVVRVRVNSAGAVISAAVVGACAHELLCEDALRTVRAASPFPPPPPVLGALIDVSVPVTYRLE
ncbi:MAG TPA: TonB family protein, partial [Polyangia bacterium]